MMHQIDEWLFIYNSCLSKIIYATNFRFLRVWFVLYFYKELSHHHCRHTNKGSQLPYRLAKPLQTLTDIFTNISGIAWTVISLVARLKLNLDPGLYSLTKPGTKVHSRQVNPHIVQNYSTLHFLFPYCPANVLLDAYSHTTVSCVSNRLY